MGKRTNTAVWMEKQQRWQIKVQKNGERRAFTSATPGRTGQREANRKADAWLDDGIANTRVLVKAAYADWLVDLQMTTSCSNWEPLDCRWRKWVIPYIGNRKLDDLTEQHLQNCVNRAYAVGRSKKYLTSLCSELRAFCKWLRLGRRSTLFPEALHVPKGARSKEKEILQPDAMRVLFAEDSSTWRGKLITDPFINAYRFSAVTGLRPGEMIGLRWSDIKGHTLRVCRSINLRGEETQGKNQNALRSFVLTPTARAILADQQKLTGDQESVFCIPTEKCYRNSWKRYCAAHGLTYIPPYNLRHTFVSLAKTMPEGTVKSLVGHSRQMDTFGVYAHLVNGEEQRTADQLEGVLKKVLSPGVQ